MNCTSRTPNTNTPSNPPSPPSLVQPNRPKPSRDTRPKRKRTTTHTRYREDKIDWQASSSAVRGKRVPPGFPYPFPHPLSSLLLRLRLSHKKAEQRPGLFPKQRKPPPRIYTYDRIAPLRQRVTDEFKSLFVPFQKIRSPDSFSVCDIT